MLQIKINKNRYHDVGKPIIIYLYKNYIIHMSAILNIKTNLSGLTVTVYQKVGKLQFPIMQNEPITKNVIMKVEVPNGFSYQIYFEDSEDLYGLDKIGYIVDSTDVNENIDIFQIYGQYVQDKIKLKLTSSLENTWVEVDGQVSKLPTEIKLDYHTDDYILTFSHEGNDDIVKTVQLQTGDIVDMYVDFSQFSDTRGNVKTSYTGTLSETNIRYNQSIEENVSNIDYANQRGSSVSKDAQCTSGEFICMGNDFYECAAGEWRVIELESPQCGYVDIPVKKETTVTKYIQNDYVNSLPDFIYDDQLKDESYDIQPQDVIQSTTNDQFTTSQILSKDINSSSIQIVVSGILIVGFGLCYVMMKNKLK